MTIKGCSAMVMAVGLDGGDGREEMEGVVAVVQRGKPLQSGEKARQICIEIGEKVERKAESTLKKISSRWRP